LHKAEYLIRIKLDLIIAGVTHVDVTYFEIGKTFYMLTLLVISSLHLFIVQYIANNAANILTLPQASSQLHNQFQTLHVLMLFD
jgi:hypothetical protein